MGAPTLDKSLAKKLIAKKLINETTEVTARYKGSSISGDTSVISTDIFTVSTINENVDAKGDPAYTLTVTSTRDGTKRMISVESIIEIDGMDPNRFASVYDIKADGTNATVAKRRGRKPKDRSKPQV